MHESKMRPILYKFVQLRSAPLSFEKRGNIVRELDNASRNRCDATRWRDNFSGQAHPTQRHAVRMHLRKCMTATLNFEKLEHRKN